MLRSQLRRSNATVEKRQDGQEAQEQEQQNHKLQGSRNTEQDGKKQDIGKQVVST
jgi:hypothetical protein